MSDNPDPGRDELHRSQFVASVVMQALTEAARTGSIAYIPELNAVQFEWLPKNSADALIVYEAFTGKLP